MKVCEALSPLLIVGVLKLPSSAVALCGACPVLCHVTVSPTAMLTDTGEKNRSPMVTLAEADLCAFGVARYDPPPEGASAGDLSPPREESAVRPSAGGGSVGVPAAAPSVDGSVCGVPGSVGRFGVVGVVVVASVVVPASCATEIAGTAQLNARTSIPLAKALAPFIHRIVWGIDS